MFNSVNVFNSKAVCIDATVSARGLSKFIMCISFHMILIISFTFFLEKDICIYKEGKEIVFNNVLKDAYHQFCLNSLNVSKLFVLKFSFHSSALQAGIPH